MSKIKIKAESLAERCEICHQADCFDPVANHCSRCAGVSVVAPNRFSNSSIYMDAVNDARLMRQGGTAALVSAAADIVFMDSGHRLMFAALALAIGIWVKGLNILRVLRNVSANDPDWAITRKRTVEAMTVSGIAGLIGIFWLLLKSFFQR